MTATASQFGQWTTGQYTKFSGANEVAHGSIGRDGDERFAANDSKAFRLRPEFAASRCVEQKGPAQTTETYYVDTASTGGDGTTTALSGATAAYTTLNAAWAARVGTRNLRNENVVIHIYCAASTGAADTTQLAGTAAVGDSGNYVHVHGDQPSVLATDTSKYRMARTDGTIIALSSYPGGIRFSDIHIQVTVGAGASGLTATSLSNNTSIAEYAHIIYERIRSECVSMSASRTSQVHGFWCDLQKPNARVSYINCVAVGYKGAGASHAGFSKTSAATADVACYNCTSYGNGIGFNASAPILAKNCGTAQCTDGYFSTFASNSTNNASDLGSDAPGSNPQNVTPTFVSAPSDLHLSSSDTAWKDLGTDLSSDTRYAFSTDGDNVLRAGTWDIGADESIAAYVVAADAGAYVLTGVSATELRTYIVPANAGAYTVTGANATVLAARKLPAAAGSYAITGAAGTLLYGHKVNAAAGAYTITGVVANILATRKLASVAGSYATTGATATLTKGYRVGATAGAYTVTGSSALVIATRRLSLTAGAYNATGDAATLDYTDITAYELIASTGAYSLSGAAATETAVRLMAASSGAYSETGAAANFTAGRSVSAGAGAYSVTGTIANVRRQYPFAADTGVYAANGSDATLHYQHDAVLDADAGVYVVAGSDASLVQRFLGPPTGGTTTTGGGGGGIVVIEQRVVERPQRIIVEVEAGEPPVGEPEPTRKPEPPPPVGAEAGIASSPSREEPPLGGKAHEKEGLAAPSPEPEQPTPSAPEVQEAAPEPPTVVQPSPVTTVIQAATPQEAAAELVRQLQAQPAGFTQADLAALTVALVIALED